MIYRKATFADVEAIYELVADYAKQGVMLARSRNTLYETLRDMVVAIDDDGKLHIFDNESLHRTKVICILYFVSYILFVPSFCFNFFFISIRIDKILYIKILALCLFLVELLTASFVILSYPALFYLTFLLTILLAYVMQDQLNYFYTTIIPSDFQLMRIKGLSCIYIIRYLGNIFGSTCSLFGMPFSYEDKSDLGYLFIAQNSFCILLQFLVLLLFFKNANNFADRPIRRIIYSIILSVLNWI